MQTNPKHRKNQGLAGHRRAPPPPRCLLGGSQGGPSVAWRDRAGKAGNRKPPAEKKLANAGPGEAGMGGCSRVLPATPGSSPSPAPGPSPVAGLHPGAAPPLPPAFYPLVLGFFGRGGGGMSGELCFSGSSAGGMLVPNNPALLSRMLAPIPVPLLPAPRGCGQAGALRAARPRGRWRTCPYRHQHRHGGAELLLGAPQRVMGEQSNPLHPVPPVGRCRPPRWSCYEGHWAGEGCFGARWPGWSTFSA